MKYCSGYPKFTSDEKGFISYFGVERPYLYNNHTLTIFPSNEEDAENAYDETERVIFWETDVSPLPESFFGSTYDGRKAVFLITDDGMIENGVVIFYSVTAFFYHLPCLELEDKQNTIQGLTISLPELNSFFPPEKAYELSWKVKDTGTDYTVKTNSREEHSCGSFVYKDTTISLGIFHDINPEKNSKTPLHIQSKISLEFSKPMDENTISLILSAVRKSFQFVFMRKNILFSAISLFVLNEKQKRTKIGYVSYNQPNFIKENFQSPKMRYIPFHVIGNSFSILVKEYLEQVRVFEEYPDCYDNQKTYNTARNVGNFIAFDAYYENYPYKMLRNEIYENMKHSILSKIDEIASNESGKKKKYAEQIGKQLSNVNVSMAEHYCKVFEQHPTIFEPAIKQIYETECEKREIAERLKDIRNALVHGRTNFLFESIHFKDLHLFQIMVYVIRLTNLGLCDDQIKKGISSLFKISFHQQR